MKEQQAIAGTNASKDVNPLFPVFLKLEQLRLLIIGGGKVALEKLEAVLGNAPGTSVTLVAKEVAQDIKTLASAYAGLHIEERGYVADDIRNADLVIAAVNNIATAQEIRAVALKEKKLINVADKPELCDFYLGSIVKKGHLKIAISTNGKSPTIAKRLRETLSASIPEEMDDLLNNMQHIRNQLTGSFDQKVKVLNQITKELAVKSADSNAALHLQTRPENEMMESSVLVASATRRSKPYLIGIGLFLIIAFAIYIIYAFGLSGDILHFLNKDHHLFYWMLLIGFLAEIVAGSMGMGYGVICTSILLMLNVAPAVVSASIHSAESFTTAAGSISHFKLGNVNKKLTKALAIPAIIGAIIGAISLSYLGEKDAKLLKPFIGAYTLYLGVRILMNVFKKKNVKIKPKSTRLTPLGLIGGFIDSFGGGGWGPLVTGTLIKNGRTPRYVIGSSTVAKFILTLTSAITFVFTLGVQHWNIVLGLLIGGIVTAPFSAMLTSKLPAKKMFVVVGALVIIMSLVTIYKALFL
ncbi:ABC transporter permease [Niabella ginsenosidivorans]|uniref:Probable membrane transporter protein n=1 Tax=Niabella ginsenosidivorans TaxID=1176587 RepID=A0A1A9I542_9BACT|nr:TSUP family transporter [Niabella ginsenosidivorans]ANH82798.1 ABC transporter permease [Niabella ginsenosidivorans]